MKLILINKTDINVYYFNRTDSRIIAERCKAADKQWTDGLLGFFINASSDNTYAAVTVKGNDGIIESMEYVDIDSNKPEFSIDDNFLIYLSSNAPNTEISLKEFESVLTEILYAPLKARQWQVYPEINKHYPLEH